MKANFPNLLLINCQKGDNFVFCSTYWRFQIGEAIVQILIENLSLACECQFKHFIAVVTVW